MGLGRGVTFQNANADALNNRPPSFGGGGCQILLHMEERFSQPRIPEHLEQVNVLRFPVLLAAERVSQANGHFTLQTRRRFIRTSFLVWSIWRIADFF